MKKLRILSLILVFALTLNIAPCYAADTYSADYSETVYCGSAGGRYQTSYYDMLSPLSRIVYEQLEANIENTKTGTAEISFVIPREYNLNELPFEETDFYSDAVAAFKRDHAEVFWIDFSKLHLNGRSENGGAWKVILSPSGNNYFISDFTSAAQVEAACREYDASINSILETVNKKSGKIMKLTAIHEWLIRNNEYNSTYFSGSAFESYSAIMGNTNGSGCPVCEGYSKAFKVLCDRINIPCVCISGYGVNNGSRELHMWNAVKLDGSWYGVDVTWDEGMSSTSISEEYLLVGSDTVINEDKFSVSHEENPRITQGVSSFYGPVLSKNAYSSRKNVTGMNNFGKKRRYINGMFSDVDESKWYAEYIISAYERELMMGYENGVYGVDDGLTVAQTITIAARINAIYSDEVIPSAAAGESWYAPYVKFCREKGIISKTYNYDAYATRAEFAQILGNALPESELQAINIIADGAIPDIDTHAGYSFNVYRLYRAGVLTGNDEKGTFGPETNINRSQVAAIIARLVDPDLRVDLNLK